MRTARTVKLLSVSNSAPIETRVNDSLVATRVAGVRIAAAANSREKQTSRAGHLTEA